MIELMDEICLYAHSSKRKGECETLLVVHVRYQVRSGVRILLVFMDAEFNHERKDSEVD